MIDVLRQPSNQAQPKTLASLRKMLAIRLGMGTQTPSLGPVKDQLDEFLRDAQEQLYWEYEWEYLRTYFPTTLVVNQVYYPWANMRLANGDTPEPRRIRSLSVVISSMWTTLREGIPPQLYTLTVSSIPQRYARREDQQGNDVLEIWPTPSTPYVIQLEGCIALRPMEQDQDRTTLDPRLVFLFALANAKAHYGQVDAQLVMSNAQALLNRLRSQNHGNERYVPDDEADYYVPPLPLFVGNWQN